MQPATLQKTEEKTSDTAAPVLQRQEEPDELEQENTSEVNTPIYLQASVFGSGSADNPEQDGAEETDTTSDVQEFADEQTEEPSEVTDTDVELQRLQEDETKEQATNTELGTPLYLQTSSITTADIGNSNQEDDFNSDADSSPDIQKLTHDDSRRSSADTSGVSKAGSSLAVTRNAKTDFTPDLNRHPLGLVVRAHEAVHRNQFAAINRPAGSISQLESDADVGAATMLRGGSYRPNYFAPAGTTLHFDPVEMERTAKRERRALTALGPRAAEGAYVGVGIGSTEDRRTGNQSRHFHVLTQATGDKGSINSSTDLWLTLDFTDPTTTVLRPISITVNPELGLARPERVPAYPVNITYVRAIQYTDKDGRQATATVTGSVHFTLETWFERIEGRELSIDTLIDLLGDDGSADVEFKGRGPVQPYLQSFVVPGNSLAFQNDRASIELRAGGVLPITSHVRPTFLHPRQAAGEQFENLNAFLESADLIELMRRIQLEFKRASREKSWIERWAGRVGGWLGDLGEAISDLWSSLPAPVRGVLKALGKAALVIAGVAAVAGLVVLVTGGAVAFGTAMLVIGAIMLAAGYVYSFVTRSIEVAKHGKWWQIPFIPLVATLDAVGLGPFIEAFTDKSILTGREYNRNEEDRWESGTLGLIQMIAIFFGVRSVLKGRVSPMEPPGRGGTGKGARPGETVEPPGRAGAGRGSRPGETIEPSGRVTPKPPKPFEPSAEARALAKKEGIPIDEATALIETAGRSTTDPHGVRLIGENAIARFFGVARNAFRLPEAIMQMRNGRYILTEVKNQRFPDIGNALGKFRDVIGLMRTRASGFRIGRLELYISRSRFQGFNDAGFTIGRGGILLYNGRPYFVEGAPGIPVRVIFRELGPPAGG